jgi:rubrerythrin
MSFFKKAKEAVEKAKEEAEEIAESVKVGAEKAKIEVKKDTEKVKGEAKRAKEKIEEKMENVKSLENLKNAFAGESQANRRYIAFSKKADNEGYPQIAKLFRAAAGAETVHALNHLRIMGENKSTLDNLNTAVSGETFEYTKMYPEYLDLAKEEGKKPIAWSFEVANKVEKIHANLFKKAIESLKNNKEIEKKEYFVCSICGNTVEDEAPEKCPICNAPKTKFLRVS